MGRITESDILKACKHRLDYWESQNVIIHYDRINSGKMSIGGRWIQMAKAGTPDIIAYLRYNNICWVLFFECKRDEKAKWSDEQKKFCDKFTGFENVIYTLVISHKQIDQVIEGITNHTENIIGSIEI